ncbi:MAG: hypothetical protein ABIK07_10725 [Planctomycetota bacterium]
MNDTIKGLVVVIAALFVIAVTLGCVGFYVELKQLKTDCLQRGYGEFVVRDSKTQFMLFDEPMKPKTKADRRPSEARPCGDLAGRKVKIAGQ